MSTKFYLGQNDYIEKLNALDDAVYEKAVYVVSATVSAPTGVVSGYNLRLTLTGNAGLQGTILDRFEVTTSSGMQTVTPVGNSATLDIPVSGTVGTVLNVSVVAVDNQGNRSKEVTASSTITANSAPTGVITYSGATDMGSGTTAQVSFNGVVDADGTPFTYSIVSSGTWQMTFSKTSGILAGELVTMTAPDAASSGTDQTVTFTVKAVDAEGAESTPKTVTVGVFASTVIGVVAKSVAGASSVLGYVDAYGNDTTPSGTFFNTFAPYQTSDVTIDGQVMVMFPKFYYKIGTISGGANDGKQAWWISDLPRGGFTLHPAFKNGGVDVNQVYIGKYPGGFEYVAPNTKLTSKADTVSTQQGSVTTLKTMCEARNTGGVIGFSMLNVWHWSVLQLLSLVEFKSFSMPANTTSYRGVQKLCPGQDGISNSWVMIDGLSYNKPSKTFNIYDRVGSKTYEQVVLASDFPTSGTPSAFHSGLSPAFIGSAFGASYLSPSTQSTGTGAETYYPIVVQPGLTSPQMFSLRLTATAAATGETYNSQSTGYSTRLAKV